MESNETLEQAAARETEEETGVVVDIKKLRFYGVAAMPNISELYVGFLVIVGDAPRLVAGPECTEVEFFSEATLPWSELSYPDIGYYLRVYFGEHRSGSQVIHFGSIENTLAVDKSYRIDKVDEAHRARVGTLKE